MKPFYTLLLALLLNCGLVYAQGTDYKAELKNYTADFEKAETPEDYQSLINKLQRLTKAYPDSAKTHYLLAYCYSRYNSGDGKGIAGMQLSLVLKASAELEKVNALEPKYKGELVTLDPYSKLTSEWGCMALAYLDHNKKDSTLWAFKQGKKRGGFRDHTLAICRAALNKCSKGAILVSSGDNFTLPLYYLQLSEGLRTDVSIVDISLLNAGWYPQFLTRLMGVKTGLKTVELDTIEHEKWSPAMVSIPIGTTGKSFSWKLKPSYEDEYLLRGDRIFLSILKTNKFNRDIYFTKAFTEGDRLSLGEDLLKFASCDKLNVNHAPQLSFDAYIQDAKSFIAGLPPAGANSEDELMIVNCLRYDIIDKLEKSMESGDASKKAELLKLLNTNFPEAKFPYISAEVKDYINKLSKE